MGTTWLGWLSRLGAGVVTCLGGGAISYSQAIANIPRPPNQPNFHPALVDVLHWIITGQDPYAATAALFSGIGLIATVYPLLGEKPYSARQAQKDRAHQNDSFKSAEEQQQARHEELLATIAKLTEKIEQTAPQQAAPFSEALTGLAESRSPSDVAIAQEAASGDIIGAYEALIARGNEDKLRNAERFRQAARLIAPFEPSKAKAAYEEAVALDPEDLWSWIELGRLRVKYDTLAAARACFGNAMQHVGDERDRSVLHDEFGDILIAEGHLADARSEFEAGLAIAERLAAMEPGNSEWQRDLSVSLDRLGDVEQMAGDLAKARSRFEESLAIHDRLAAMEPGNSEWQRDLSVSLDRLGDIAEEASDIKNALAFYGRSLPIAQALAENWPDHPGFQDDLEITRRRIAALEAKLRN